MSKITQTVRAACDFVRGRTGARLLLILVCLVCYFTFSPFLTPVSVTADGETYTFITFNNNDPGEIIAQVGLALDDDDQYTVDYQPTDNNDAQLTIEVIRAFDVTVTDGGTSTLFTVAGGTVSDLLSEAGIALPDEDDRINCKLDEDLYAYMEIVIDRVEYREETSTEVIEYKTVKRETSALVKGTTSVAQKGENGERTVVRGYTVVNGEVESVVVLKETINKEAINEIVDVGTAANVQNNVANQVNGTTGGAGTFVDSSGRTVSYVKILTGEGTAYTAEPGALTSTGKVAQVGIVAVNPKVIPYGTRLYITSADGRIVYGYALAGDTGGALLSGRVLVDLYYDTESQCRAFGRRDVIVYVLG